MYRWYNACEKLKNESLEAVHRNLARENAFKDMVGLFDGAWLHRGHDSQHGSAAVVDVRSGAVLFAHHRSKDKSHFGRVPHDMSSGMMEVSILTQILEESEKKGAKFKMMVADADVGLRSVIRGAGIRLARCCNHGGKNLANAGINIGKVDGACDCPIRMTKAKPGEPSRPFTDGTKAHSKITIDVAKKAQAAFGAVTSTHALEPEKWKKMVRQIIYHLSGDHISHTVITFNEHPDYTDQLSFFSDWDFVDVERQCGPSCTALQVHEPGVTDLWVGTGPKNPAKWPKHEEKRRTRDEIHARHCPFMDAEVEREGACRFDCRYQRDQWLKYCEDNLICDVDMFCTPQGAVRTNLVESVWHSWLKFRKKDSNIGGDRYVMLSNLACAFYNQPYIMQWEPGYCARSRLAEILGVPVNPLTKAAWTDSNKLRMKTSAVRRTDEHHKKANIVKQRRRTARQLDAADRKKRTKAYKHEYCSGGNFTAKEGGGSAVHEGKVRVCKKCGSKNMHMKSARICVDCQSKQVAK